MFTSFPGGVKSIAISVYVCLSICISQKQHVQNLPNFYVDSSEST